MAGRISVTLWMNTEVIEETLGGHSLGLARLFFRLIWHLSHLDMFQTNDQHRGTSDVGHEVGGHNDGGRKSTLMYQVRRSWLA